MLSALRPFFLPLENALRGREGGVCVCACAGVGGGNEWAEVRVCSPTEREVCVCVCVQSYREVCVCVRSTTEREVCVCVCVCVCVQSYREGGGVTLSPLKA